MNIPCIVSVSLRMAAKSATVFPKTLLPVIRENRFCGQAAKADLVSAAQQSFSLHVAL